MQEEVKHYKVKTLGTNLRPNSVYYVKDTSQSSVKTYITDQGGFPFPLIDLMNGGSTGSVQSVTGSGVTGTLENPVVNISTFKSSDLGNLIQISTNDGKLFVKPIISPDGSIEITDTASYLELKLGLSLQNQIQNALQSGDNVSELNNDAEYITQAEIDNLGLQQITDNGATTTNPITVGGITSGNLFSDGYSFGISDNLDGNYNFQYIPYAGLTFDDFNGQQLSINSSGINFGGGNLSNPFNSGSYWYLPSNSGTIALTSDIPSLSGYATQSWVNSNFYPSNNPSNFVSSSYVSSNYYSISNPSGFITSSALSPYLLSITASSTYFPIPTGSTSQYIKGDGSLGTFPSYSTPSLDSVTTAGNSSSNPILINDNTFTNYLELGNNYISFRNTGFKYIELMPLSPATSTRTIYIPDANGQMALTSDIPSVGTWGALNYPTWVSGTPFVKMTAAGTFALDTNSYLTSISGISAGGDLQGSYPNPTVHQIQGQAVQNGNPTDGDFLQWDNTANMWKHLQLAYSKVITALGFTPANKAGETFTGSITATNLSGTNTGDETNTTIISKIGFTPENSANKGVNNGYAGLDSSGKVPSSQLPSYVDDVLEYANFASLPSPGETGKIYITLDTNLEYRWSGSTYVNIAKGDVQSVNTKTGAVVLNTDDIAESGTPTNKWWTNARTITSTLSGFTSGAGTVSSSDTILQAIQKIVGNIANLVTGVSSVNTKTGAVTLTTNDIADSTDKRYQTENQKTFNDATSSIQSQLNNKQPLLGYTPYRYINTTQTTVTGTTAETIVATAIIPANTFNSSDIMKVLFRVTRTAGTSQSAFKVRINTSNTLTGAVQIATNNIASTNTISPIQRTFSLSGGNLYGAPFTSAAITDIGTTNTNSSTPYNTANTLYVFFTITLVTSGDNTTLEFANITN